MEGTRNLLEASRKSSLDEGNSWLCLLVGGFWMGLVVLHLTSRLSMFIHYGLVSSSMRFHECGSKSSLRPLL